MAVASFSRMSGAPYHFLNLGPPDNQAESKAMSKTGKRKCWKQGLEKQFQTVITATTSTILEFSGCIATAISVISDTLYCNFPQY